jgi:hypothetical protein
MRVPRTRVSAPARAARGVATAREGDAGRGRSVRARSCAGRAKWCPARPPRPFRGIPTSAPKVRRFRREFGVGEFQIRYRGRTGDFEARARVRGRVLFLDPARAIRGSATPRRSAPVATPASLDSISSQPTALGARGAGTRPSGGGRRRVRATRRRFARDVRRAGGVRGVRVRVGAMEGAGWGRRAPDGEGDAGARSPRSRGGDRARRLERRRRVLADRAIATRRPGIRARGVGRRARDARVPRPGRRRASPRPARHPARS